MSNAIRDVTIRVKIEQVTPTFDLNALDPIKSKVDELVAHYVQAGQKMSGALISPGTFAEQAAGFQSIADAVQHADAAAIAAASSTQQVASAADQNFEALIREAQAETTLESATRRTTTAQKLQSVENIQGAGNALRAAAAGGDLSQVIASLGQALMFSVKQVHSQSAANAGNAISAGVAGTANEFQAVAIGHVSAAGARAATANAALSASNAAVGTTATFAGRAMAFMSANLGPIMLGIAAVSLAVQVGGSLWTWWAGNAVDANKDIQDAVKQRLAAEQQSAAIEAGIMREQIRLRGEMAVAQDRYNDSLVKYRSLQQQLADNRDKSTLAKLQLNDDDPATRLAILNQRQTERENALRSSGGELGFRFGPNELASKDVAAQTDFAAKMRFGGGGINAASDALESEKKRVQFLKDGLAYQDSIKQREEQRAGALRQQLQIEMQSRDVLKDRLRTIQEQIQAEQGRLQTAAERFAQMDPGERERLKETAKKAQSGGELSLQEAQLLSQSGLGQQQASQAFERIANQNGFQQVAGNLGEFNQIRSLEQQGTRVSEQAKEVDQRIQKTNGEITRTLNAINSMVDIIGTLGANVATLDAKIEKLQQDIDQKQTASRGGGGAPVRPIRTGY